MARAFFTYSHKDSEFVEQLVADLETSGLSVVFDKRLLRPGDSLLAIFEEIGAVNFLLAVLSPHLVRSNWVKKELAVAVIREIEEPDFKVIPIIKENCQIPEKLKQALRDKYQARFNSNPYEVVIKETMQALSLPMTQETYTLTFRVPLVTIHFVVSGLNTSRISALLLVPILNPKPLGTNE